MNVFELIFNPQNMENNQKMAVYGVDRAVQSQNKAIMPSAGKDGVLKAIAPSAIGFKISDLSDEQLYKKCVECGMNAKVWIRKFVAMLPEVEKRCLYKKKGFVSIYDFAKKLAGMSDFTVDRILRLVKKIQDKPILLRQFESGKQSWSKIETVAYIATKETDEDLAEKVSVLPQHALVAYVSQKRAEGVSAVDGKSENTNILSQELYGFEKMFGGDGNAHINYQDVRKEERYKVFLFHASIDVQFKLRLFKQRLEKERKQSFSWNEVFEILLRRLEENVVEKVRKVEKVENAEKIEKTCVVSDDDRKAVKVASRHIPVELKRQILAKYCYKCAFPKCNFPCFVLHHTKRFVLFRRHDAESIVPLCKKHHDLVHGGCIANEEDTPEKWVLKKAGGECGEGDGLKKASGDDGAKKDGGGEGLGKDVSSVVDVVIDKHTGEVLDTKEKVDAVVMKYKMKLVK